MRRFLWIATLLIAGCKVDTAPMEDAHIQRVEGINRQYDAQVAENDARWSALQKKVRQRLKYRIPTVKGTAAQPLEPVADSFKERWAACQQAENVAACLEGLRAEYSRALAARYFLADFAEVRRQLDANPDLDLEWLATKSHNEHLLKQVTEEIAELEKEKTSFRRTLNGYRRDEIQSSRDERDREIESAEQENRARWAAALQGFSEGLQAASRSQSQQNQGQAYSETGCTSDFACGFSQRCVKSFGHTTGVCMKAVNENGLPSLSGPSTDSVLPNLPSSKDCTARGCPAGFRCDYSSGVCIR